MDAGYSAGFIFLSDMFYVQQRGNEMQYQTETTEKGNHLMKREISYQVQMLLTKKLLRMGLVTQSEYAEIDTILRRKLRPSLSTTSRSTPTFSRSLITVIGDLIRRALFVNRGLDPDTAGNIPS